MKEKKFRDSSDEPVFGEVWVAGGPVWINFANTIALASKGMVDVTESFDSLRWWLGAMGLAAPDVVRSEDLAFARNFRLFIARIGEQIERGESIDTDDVHQINSVLRDQRRWDELEPIHDGHFAVRTVRLVDTIEQALGPVAESLCETLVHGDPARLRTCAHPDCVLKFYDDSKNGTRRWCTMSGCGNRAKAAAFLTRKRTTSKSVLG